MSWKSHIEELRARERLAEQMGGEERVARQRSQGKLTVRERVAFLERDRLLAPDIQAMSDWALSAKWPAAGLMRRSMSRPIALNSRWRVSEAAARMPSATAV